MTPVAATEPPDTGRPVIEVYEAGLRATMRGDRRGWRVRHDDGRSTELPLAAWAGAERPGDPGLLTRCLGPTVDLGCGAGRLTALLTGRGVPALGVDIAPYAVRLTRSRGGLAIRRDLFGPLPGEGRWQHALLADGNVGIGGDPALLLRRCARLLRPGGILLCETDPPGSGLRVTRTRLEPPAGPASEWFPWAHVDPEAIAVMAGGSGFCWAGSWTSQGRWFTELNRPRRTATAADAIPRRRAVRGRGRSSSSLSEGSVGPNPAPDPLETAYRPGRGDQRLNTQIWGWPSQPLGGGGGRGHPVTLEIAA